MNLSRAIGPETSATPTEVSPRLTVTEAATASRRHPVTVYRALEDGSLHGTQAVKGGRWLIRVECLEAWIDATTCQHQTDKQATVISLAGRRRTSEVVR